MQATRPFDHEFEMPSLRLDDRIALVTGASRGLGLGIALALAHAGANLALAARSEEKLEQAEQLARELGQRAIVIPTDIRNLIAVRKMVSQTVAEFGRLDILVNAAGVNFRQPADDITEEQWDQLMAVNLKGMFFACQEAGRVMRRQRRGKIINLGSLSFEIVVPNISPYAISKGGVRQLTRSLAVEWASHGINVNAIAPGRFWTDMTDNVFSSDKLYQSAVSVIPQGRPGIPSDLAGAAVLLASDASDYITGQTIVVDGGWLVSGGVKA